MFPEIDLKATKVESLLSEDPSLTLHELAQALGTDRHKIEQSIRARYGFSFRELKKRVRLERALTLLEMQRGSYIKEIAAEVGLTPNYLSHFVKSMTGRLATDVRRQKS
jgi:AraC-like DNA-binding protein